jgi:hypothetical protein
MKLIYLFFDLNLFFMCNDIEIEAFILTCNFFYIALFCSLSSLCKYPMVMNNLPCEVTSNFGSYKEKLVVVLINYTLITFGSRDYGLHMVATLKELVKVANFLSCCAKCWSEIHLVFPLMSLLALMNI